MKLKYFSVILSLLTVMFFVMTEPVGIAALDNDRVPDIDSTQSKTLTLYFYVQLKGVDTPIEGAEMGIYRLSDLVTNGGSAEYPVLEAYASLRTMEDDKDVTFEGISVSESVLLADSFANAVSQPDQTAVTDKNGRCSFEGLEQGMYLVRQLSAKGQAQDYQFIAPYLISVPLAVNYTGENEWQYEVLSEPKSKPKPISEVSDHSEPFEDSDTDVSAPLESSEPSKPESSKPESSQPESSVPPTNTGDGSIGYMAVFMGLWCVSAVTVVLVNQKRRGADKHE